MKRDDLIGVMESFLGTKENPPGSNLTPIGQEFGWNGVSWCAETVSVACNRLGFPLHEAAVIRIENHGRAGDWGMGWTDSPVIGSAVCYDWNGRGNWADMHVGVVTDDLGGGRFRTIEGNYADSCQRVLRDMTYVRGFATFPFENDVAPAAPTAKGIIVNGANRSQGGYALVGPDGGVFCYEDAPFLGSLVGKVHPSKPIVAMAWNLTGDGYWLLGADGGVFTFGAAPFFGGYLDLPEADRNDPNREFVEIVANKDGGYTIFTPQNNPYHFNKK